MFLKCHQKPNSVDNTKILSVVNTKTIKQKLQSTCAALVLAPLLNLALCHGTGVWSHNIFDLVHCHGISDTALLSVIWRWHCALLEAAFALFGGGVPRHFLLYQGI